MMNLRTKIFAAVALWAVFAAGCKDNQSDRPTSPPKVAEPDAPSPETAVDPDKKPDSPPDDTPKTDPDEPADPPKDVVVDLDAFREEIAALERDAQFFEAFKRVRDLKKTYRDRPEASELNSLQNHLYQYHRRSSGLKFAISQLGSDSETAVSVATGKLLDAGEVGSIFLRKAVRQAEPKVAVGAAEILLQQREPQITALMVERMEQDPPEPLGDELGKLLMRLDTIESEWIDRLCALARREGSSRAGAVAVLIDRLDKSIRAQLEPAKPKAGEAEAVKKDEPKQGEPPPIEVAPRLVRTLYDVAVDAQGPIQRQAVEALLILVLEQVNHRDGQAFNQLVDNDQAYGVMGDYVIANLESEQLEDRRWAIGRAELLRMRAAGFWARVQIGDDPAVLDERLDPALSFADINALRATGPVEKGQTVRWTGFVNVPADGDYKFSVDCAETSPTTLSVDEQQTTADTAVELSAGWHEVKAQMSLSGDQALIQVAWEGPGLASQAIPADRVACADRTRTLIWQLGRKCDLAKARSLAGQLLTSLERVDEELAEKLMVLAQLDDPARPAVAAALAEVLDYSLAHQSEPPKWEPRALPLLLAAAEQITGAEQRRVVASLVNYFVRRTGSKIEDFNSQAQSPEAYGRVRAFIAERLDDQEPEVARWAMQQAGAVQLALTGLWAKTYAQLEPAEENDPLHERLDSSLNFADAAALKLGLAKRITWQGYLNVPVQGAYTFSADAAGQIAIRLDDEAVQPGKAVELAAGLHPAVVQFRVTAAAPKLVLSWQPPGKTAPEAIPADRFLCPDWPKVLTWEMTEKPQQAEAIAARLRRMADRIDQPLAEQVLALIKPDNPSALPAAEVLARALSHGHLDDTLEKTLPEHLWPFVDKTDGPQQRVLAGALIEALGRLFANNGPEFDKAVKAEGAFQTLRDFVAARLDAEDMNVAAWAVDHTGPFGLGHTTGLWLTRLASPDGPPVRELHSDNELNLADLAAVTAAAQAKQGEAIRWTGYLRCPSDGQYVFTIDDAKGSPAKMKVAGQTVQSGKPIELPAGLHPLDVQLTIGPDAKLVVNWQPPGSAKAELISRSAFACPAWPKLLLWQLQQGPEAKQAEDICFHLARMADQVDQPLTEQLLPLVKPDNPIALPAGELLSRVLRNGHLDDTFEKTLPEHLWPLFDKTDGPRQRVLAGSLIDALRRLFADNGPEFDKAVKVEGAFQTLRDFVAARLDDEEAEVTAWALDHAGPFGLVHTGLWLKRLASPDGPPVGERHHGVELNLADPAAVTAAAQTMQGEAIRFTGYLRCPADGKYTFTITAANGSPYKMEVAGQAIQSGKPIELPAGLHPVHVHLTVGPDARLLVRWQPPGGTQAELISRNSFFCPAWAKLLLWQLQQEPDLAQAEKLGARLARMVDRIDQPMATELLAMIKPDSPTALPAAEVLVRVLSHGHLDDTFEKTLPKRLWPFVDKTEDQRQRVLVGSLVTALEKPFANNGAEFDKAVKMKDASVRLREFVTERLDAEDRSVRLWAAEHAGPFALLVAGLEGSYFDAAFKTRLFDRVDAKLQFEPGQFAYLDKREDNMGIRWSGLIAVPADGVYTFSCTADDTCRLWLDDKPVIQDAKKPTAATLTAGLHEIRVEFVETTGPERLTVNWQPPGQPQPQVLAGELKHVDQVQLLLSKLTGRPDDPQSAAWLAELSYKTDRLDAASLDKLIPLAQKNAALKTPLASVLAAAILRDPQKAPPKAAPQLSKSVPTLKDVDRRQAVEALAFYFSAACGSDKAKFQQAVGSAKTYDLLCDEVRSAAQSTQAADVKWAEEQAKILGLKLGEPDK